MASGLLLLPRQARPGAACSRLPAPDEQILLTVRGVGRVSALPAPCVAFPRRAASWSSRFSLLVTATIRDSTSSTSTSVASPRGSLNGRRCKTLTFRVRCSSRAWLALTSPSAYARSSACLAINPFLSCLKSDGQSLRLRWNTLGEWHDDTTMTIRAVSRLPDLDHR
jgi:hypothetical protein